MGRRGNKVWPAGWAVEGKQVGTEKPACGRPRRLDGRENGDPCRLLIR